MINQFGFVSEETFAEKMDTQNVLLAGLLESRSGSIKPTSWTNVQALVRAGLHKKVFSIGDQLVCQKGSSNITWDVIGIDHDTPADSQFTHSMTLQMHECLPNMVYDVPEALYYAENGLEAGTYNFTIQSGYETSYGGGKTYQFTLENNVPVGGQLTFGWTNNTLAVNAKITSYASATSATQIEQVSVAEGNSGTSLGTTDGTTTNLNHIHKVRFGNNYYSESAVRQFINSDGAIGNAWTYKNKFDRPPAWAADTAGFLNDLDSDFLSVLGISNKVTVISTVNGGGSVTINDKFFLLSKSEVFAGNEVTLVDEGSPYPYYSDYSDLSNAGINADSNRIKYRNNIAQGWWLRSPVNANASHARTVGATGNIPPSFSSNSYGISPACNVI